MKRCGNCGHELKMRPFRLLDDTCPHCGQFRHSKMIQIGAMKAWLILLGLAGCVILEFFLKVPLMVSIPLVLLPLSVVILLHYRPFPETQPKDESKVEKDPDDASRVDADG